MNYDDNIYLYKKYMGRKNKRSKKKYVEEFNNIYVWTRDNMGERNKYAWRKKITFM